MRGMTVAQAMRHLEVAAETGNVPGEAVAALRDALTLRESSRDRKAWRDRILARLHRLELGPADVLVLRLPAEVIADADELRKAQMAARDIAEVARRGIVLLEEGAPLTAEKLPQPPAEPSRIVRVPPGVRVPRNAG